MAKLFELKLQRNEVLQEIGDIRSKTDASGKIPTSHQLNYEKAMRTVGELDQQIKSLEANNTLAGMFDAGGPKPEAFRNSVVSAQSTRFLSAGDAAEYTDALHAFIKSGGKAHTSELLQSGSDGAGGYFLPGSDRYTRQRRANGSYAALYEGTEGGSDAAGGYSISIPTVDQIVPLGMPDLGIFDASMVIPTATDIKIPVQAAFGESAVKAESTGTLATFGGSDPTLSQVALTSFMVGALRLLSWELVQDAPTFQGFAVRDLINGQRILEGSLLATGTGSGQPLGVFGNTGTGTGSAYELTGTAATDNQLLLSSLFDVVATLKGIYQPNASWIMSRATGLAIRRAQMASNLYFQVVTNDPDGTERILGRPVYYDVNAPALPTATNAGVIPILFGNFKEGYVIGVRGGAGINVKVLDQPFAADGQLGILAYRRLDGRIRRSEAIQAVTFSHS